MVHRNRSHGPIHVPPLGDRAGNGPAKDRRLSYHQGVMKTQCTLFVIVILASLSAMASGDEGSGVETTYPARPIKVVVPFTAGGGSDAFGRIVQQAIEEESLLPQRLVIIKVPGAGGTIGSRRGKHARPDGYTLLLLHEGILTAKFAGQAAYGPEAFEPIAGTGSVDQVIAVPADSPHVDLSGFMTLAAEKPDQIVFAANLGAPSHFTGLMLEGERPGAQFRYMQAGGGAKRFAALIGGHADVSTFSTAEYVQFQSAGLRALAVFSQQRHPDLPELPTAAELGFDVISENMHFWWAPRGTPKDRTARVAEALERAMQLPSVRELLAAMQTEPKFLVGDALQEELDQREQRLAMVIKRPVPALPNLPAITLLLTMALGVWVWRSSRIPSRSMVEGRAEQTSSTGSQDSVAGDQRARSLNRLVAAAVIGLTCLYVLVLQLEWTGFRVATGVFIAVSGGLLARRWATLPALAGLAIGLSFGIHFVFTRLLVVDLP